MAKRKTKPEDKKPPGHPKNFPTPNGLQKVWNDYKAVVDSDPHLEEVLTVKGDIVTIKKHRPYTRQGFEAYCFNNKYGHVCQYLKNQDGLYDKYIPVVTHIKNEREDNQISGTLSGRFKAPNLVARINEIGDLQSTTTKVQIEGISTEELEKGLQD